MSSVFCLVFSERGSDMRAGVLSVHTTLEGAKRAILKEASNIWEDTDLLKKRLEEYLSDDGESFITEDQAFIIEECELIED